MSDGTNGAPCPRSGFEEAVDRFEAARRCGTHLPFDPFLTLASSPDEYRLTLEELIKIDLEYSWRERASRPADDRTGATCLSLEEYHTRHPELGRAGELSLDLVLWEYRVRRQWGDAPGHDEYVQRFPGRADELRPGLDRVDRELAREGPKPGPAPAGVSGWPSRPDSAESDDAGTAGETAPGAGGLLPVGPVVAALHRWNLLTPAQFRELVDQRLPERFADPVRLAREFLRRDWLTPYQVNRLVRGRAAGLVLGPYLILGRLGEGGAGEVFRARHQKLARDVAIKLIRPESLGDPNVLPRFYREMRLVSRVSHPNVVHAYDAGEYAGRPGLVMEYIDGTDLARTVRERGPLPVAQACDYAFQAASGLQSIYEHGLVHRDIKPANLMVTRSGIASPGAASSPGAAFGTVKILDLGLGRLLRPEAGSAAHSGTVISGDTAALVGTPDYLAPEQAVNFHAVDTRADIYSLGCTLYFLLTGRPPFGGATLAEKLVRHQLAEPETLGRIRPDVPPPVVEVLSRMMAKDPGRRYPEPGDVAAALARLLPAGSGVRGALPSRRCLVPGGAGSGTSGACPRPAREAPGNGPDVTLTVIEGPVRGASFRFAAHDTFLVGRAVEAHFRFPETDQYFSRLHFMVEINPPFCRLIDLGSSNGTFVNGVRVEASRLQHGDVIQAGTTVLRVDIEGPTPAAGREGRDPVRAGPPSPPDAPDDSRRVPVAPPRPAGFSAPSVPGYRVVRLVARGDTGTVYEAVQVAAGVTVALKVMVPEPGTDGAAGRWFLRASEAFGALRHRHIVRVLDRGHGHGFFWFATEFVPGKSVGEIVTENGPLSVARAVRLTCQALEALAVAHAAGLVHGDVKPANLLVTGSGADEHVKVTDFGLARLFQAGRMSGLTLGEGGGDVRFMPPERFTDFRAARPAGDQYSSAATLYHMLTRASPYNGGAGRDHLRLLLLAEPVPLSRRRPELPQKLGDVIHRALSRSPAARYPDVAAFRDALRPFESD